VKRIVHPVTPKQEIDKFYGRKFNLTSFLFDKQLAFVEDPEPFKVAVCSRRAGKTIACAAHLIHTAINNPDTMSIYITLSQKNAERIVWKDLKKINEDHKLGGIPNEAKLTFSFPNKASIHLCGANNVTEIENFRGVPLKLVYIDECQSFKAYIEELIDDIIGPALIDYAGSLCLIGTPGPVPTGFFHTCATGKNVWSKHHWTFWDNPHIATKSGKTHQQLLDRELKRRAIPMEHPSIQREWFGKWILDSDSLLLQYDQRRNHFDNLPTGIEYQYVMGIDVGFKDADAISILAWSEKDPCTYLVEELVTQKQGLTELVGQIKALNLKYNVSKMVMDMGGLGLKMGEEVIRQHGLPVEAAEKARKMENIEFLNDSLRTGKFKAKANSRFATDSYLVEIDRDKSTPDKIKVSDRYHSDIIDAVLYAFKITYGYTFEPAKPKAPKWGTKEWADQQSTSMFEREMEGYQKERDYERWARGEEN
jgi:hypothetical protein